VTDKTIQLINPNLHVILIHAPIAMLFIGTAIELLAFLWRRSSFRAAGRWMILIGALSTIPATTTGLFAARQAMHVESVTLAELKQQAQLNAGQWDQLMWHIRYNVAGTILLSILVIAWLGASDRIRRGAHFGYLAALLISVGLLTCGAWRGGELIYTHGTGVGLVEGGMPKHSADESVALGEVPQASGARVFAVLNASEKQMQKIDSPMDVHVQLAGFTAALAVVTLGLSMRALWLNPARRVAVEGATSDDDIVNAIAARGEQRTLLRDAPVFEELPSRVPAGRFWLLATVLALMTAQVGWMLVGPDSYNSAANMLKEFPRYMAHGIAGVSIVLLTLLLALFARFTPYNRVIIGTLSLLLVLALSAQVWFGILLLYDTNQGPIKAFNAAPTTQAVT
jgi:uncharacterized membrane protein